MSRLSIVVSEPCEELQHEVRPGRDSWSTLADLLQDRGRRQPNRPAYSFLVDGKSQRIDMNYGELDGRAAAIASQLASVAEVGDRAMLLYRPGLDFIAALFGCFYAGVAAVPCYPPYPVRPEPALPRLRTIVESARPMAILTTDELLPAIETHLGSVPAILATDRIQCQPGHTWKRSEVDAGTLAMVQYTSGSTGAPRGVMLTHANLLANLNIIRDAFDATEDSVGVFWLPFYHDMGLVGGVLQTTYCGGRSLFFSPTSFIQSPVRWLEAISRERATISGAPNFAFEECVRRITPEQRAELDLSCWNVAFCGAEPIRPQTLRRFAAEFAPRGFRSEAYYPCYGLAEGTLFVSGGRTTLAPLPMNEELAETEPLDSKGQSIATTAEPMTCGKPLGEQAVVIVDPDSHTCVSDGHVGEVWISGPCVARGYWNRPEETAETFAASLAGSQEGSYLRTGDLGFLRDGELFITGRRKDMIIVAGRNHYPQDLEQTAERCHPALVGGGCGAFGVEIDGEERVVIVAEVDRHRQRDLNSRALAQAARREIAQRHEIDVYEVVLVKTRSLPRTTSGKLQRHACRSAFLAGQLDIISS